MRQATVTPNGLGFTLVVCGLVREFDTMWRLLDHCKTHGIQPFFKKITT